MRRPKWNLLRGDCLDLMREIPSRSVHLVLCDLPYGATACAWDKRIAMAPLWEQYARVTNDDSVIALFAQQPFASDLAAAAPRGLLRYEWVWDKGAATGFANAHRMPMRRHENVLVFYRKLPTYHPQGLRPCRARCRRRSGTEVYDAMELKEGMQKLTGYPQSILHFKRESGCRPCQKPVALLEYLIRTYTNCGETVLDNAMGTGSSGVAAVNCARRFIGIELDADRFGLAAARISETARMARYARRCSPRSVPRGGCA